MAVFIGGIGSSNTMMAKKKQNQTNFKKAIYHGMRYNEIVNLAFRAGDMGDEKLQRKLERQQEMAFDKHLEFMNQLPKYEQARVEKIVFG